MKPHIKQNFGLFLLLIAVLVITFLLVYLPGTYADQYALTLQVTYGDHIKTLTGWQDTAGIVYFFLPGEAESVCLIGPPDTSLSVEGLPTDDAIPVDNLVLQTPYLCTLDANGSARSLQLIFMRASQTPALFIDTNSGSMEYIYASKNNAERGRFALWAPDSQEYSGTLSEISGRGNTSWNETKKSYNLFFEQPQSLLGLESAEKYVLIANARCNYLSNALAFYLEEAIGIRYVNQYAFVDLYLNGEYVGNYLLCEPVYVGENGIPITDLQNGNLQANPGMEAADVNRYTASDGNSKGVLWKYEYPATEGGFLLERDVPDYYKDEVSGFVLSSGDHYVIKSPKHAGRGQVNYIHQYLQQTYDALSNKHGTHPETGEHYSEYLDVESFALKYLLEEFLNFNDAGRSSAYYYKDASGRLCAGPGWDFEGAFLGNEKQITHLNATYFSTDWFVKLWQHEDFRQIVIEAFNQKLVPAVESLLTGRMEQMKLSILSSAEMDSVRWSRDDFVADCDEIADWMRRRVAFMNDMWNGEQKFITVTIENGWENKQYVYLSAGDILTEDMLPTYEATGVQLLGWVLAGTVEQYTFGEAVMSDVVLQPIFEAPSRSSIAVLLSKFMQIIPEVLFFAVFLVVGCTYYFVCVRRKRK